jgi:hypothetical protein
MKEYWNTRAATEEILAEGTFPTPKLVLERLALTSVRNDRRLGGRGLNSTKSLARADALKLAGYVKDVLTGQWFKNDTRATA